jgi:hypothetical protein
VGRELLWGNGQRELAARPDRGRQKRGRVFARVDSRAVARFVVSNVGELGAGWHVIIYLLTTRALLTARGIPS